MSSWIGTAIGSSIGLIAILVGALWNSHLTRKRDRTMREEEVRAISNAIGAEMSSVLELNMGKMTQLEPGIVRSTEILIALGPSEPVVWPKLCDKVGWLEADLAHDVVRAWTLMQWHIGMHKATIEQTRNGSMDKETYLQRCRFMVMDHRFIQGVLTRLTSRPPKELLLPSLLQLERFKTRSHGDQIGA
jgi:hypothetical protein